MSTQYGIVVDSGSSGSRLQIYQWQFDPEKGTSSLPVITHDKDWSKKITPGVSSFEHKPDKVWSDHYRELMQFAAERIPQKNHADTPVFVLATAGMRMLKKDRQQKLLKTICKSLKDHSGFRVDACDDYVQVIDGETEGTYGWLALNYLMASLNGDHTVGFMDMGGASTQIAFVPSDTEEIKKHDDDIGRVVLRNTDGTERDWRVFVQTWLGFGANAARERYLKMLVASSSGDTVYDACMPRGAQVKFDDHTVVGNGDYETCLKSIYPLLNKNIPCPDEPCTFDGIHTPKLDFEKDRFVGVSEYWYTANDVFGSGGEYNYHSFNEKVRDYCRDSWDSITTNAKNGDYSGLDPDRYLKNACFKASWVLNVLHEGFGLPRLGLDISDAEAGDADKGLDTAPVPSHGFSSASDVGGSELSWTLGKVLLFASSQIPAKATEENAEPRSVGIYPAKITEKKFIAGGGEPVAPPVERASGWSLLFVVVVLGFAVFVFMRRRTTGFRRALKRPALAVDRLRRYLNQSAYDQYETDAIALEAGLDAHPSAHSSPSLNPQSAFLRTRSNINLADNDFLAPVPSPGPGATSPNPSARAPTPRLAPSSSFLSRPFPSRPFTSNNNSKDSINRQD
ncbi:golgi apyrase [Diutina catenulata]